MPWMARGSRLAEVPKALLPRRGAARRGEGVLHESGEAPEFVDAARPETRVVVVEEDESALDRIGGSLEVLVPGAHLGGLVFLDLLEFRDLAVPHHPQVDLVRSHVGRRSQILVLRPYHRDVPVAKELVHVVTEP